MSKNNTPKRYFGISEAPKSKPQAPPDEIQPNEFNAAKWRKIIVWIGIVFLIALVLIGFWYTGHRYPGIE
jgi:hypothetical protein